MKYDLSSLHILVEDWEDTKRLLHNERAFRKRTGMKHADLHNGSNPRTFEYNGSAKDWFKQQSRVVNPLSIARDNLSLLRDELRERGYNKAANDPKVVDKLKAKGYLSRGLNSVPNLVKHLKPDMFKDNAGGTSMESNSIGYNRPLMNTLSSDSREAIKKHEGEHAEQGGELYRQGGNRAVRTATMNYTRQSNQALETLKNSPNLDAGAAYYAHPFEHHANMAANGQAPTAKERENMVKNYMANPDAYHKEYSTANKQAALNSYLKTLGIDPSQIG